MSHDAIQSSRDWLASTRTNVLAWWLPLVAIIAALVVPVSLRAAIWITALVWMGTACILNARRCGRTHCRYTGPYFIAMTAPVLMLATGGVSGGLFAWTILGLVILVGAGLIWWASESAFGRFSSTRGKAALASVRFNRVFSGAFAAAGLVSGALAVVAASCCVLPLLLASLGAGAGIFAALEILVEYQNPLLVFSAAMVAAAWIVYFRRQGANSTAIALTIATLLVGTAAARGHIEGPLLKIIRANR